MNRMNRIKGNNSVLRELNKDLVLTAIIQNPDLSRYEIAKRVNLSPSTVSSAVKLLLNDRLVIETGRRDTYVGRKPYNLRYNPDAGYVIGVEIDTNGITGARMNLEGSIVQLERKELNGAVEKNHVLRETAELIQKLLGESNSVGNDVLMMGLGVTGLVDVKEGVGIYSAPFGWKDVHYKEVMEKEFGIPVYVENIARLRALGENIFGSGKGADSLIYFVIEENGIGAGIILEKKIYRGIHGSAGEIGHTVMLEDGPKCHCGNYGCLEAIINNLINEARNNVQKRGVSSLGENRTTIERIVRTAEQGDKGTIEMLKTAGKYLAILIANMINALDPRVVVLSGSFFNTDGFFFNLVSDAISKDILNATTRNIRIEKDQLGDKGCVLGAGAYVLNKSLKSPLALSN